MSMVVYYNLMILFLFIVVLVFYFLFVFVCAPYVSYYACIFVLFFWHFPLYIITKKNRWCDVHFPTACYQILPHHRLHIMSLLELKPSKCFSFDIIGHSTEIQIFQHVSQNTLYYKWQYVVIFCYTALAYHSKLPVYQFIHLFFGWFVVIAILLQLVIWLKIVLTK